MLPERVVTGVSSDIDVDTEEGRRFLQRRVRHFGQIAFGLGISFWLVRLVMGATGIGIDVVLRDPSWWLHLGGASAFALCWWLCGLGSPSPRRIRSIESVTLLLGVVAYQAMGLYIPKIANPWLVVILALTYMFIARAIFVPSTARRTFILTALAGVPLTYLAYTGYRDDIAFYELMHQSDVAERYDELSLMQHAGGVAISGAAWWMLTVALSTLSSKVIYGLRREVHRAQKLGQYTLVEKIAEGGMGAVYTARHAMLRRPVAVKLLLPSRTGEQNLLRFEREVQMTARLTHPNTIRVFDYGRTPDGTFYYAMELLQGTSLDQIVKAGGPMPCERVVHLLRQVASALSEAHDEGLIHRDIKPANIIMCRQGGLWDVAKVLDFGLVRPIANQSDSQLTAAEVVTGTPLYMAPESIKQSEGLDGRVDLYSLGAVGYYLLCGDHVFTGRTAVEILGHHLHTDPPPLSSRCTQQVPAELEALLMQCLAKDPGQRPKDAAALVEALDALKLPRWDQTRATEWWKAHAELAPKPVSVEESTPLERTLHIEGAPPQNG